MSDSMKGRELHFIAIGGAGMSALALVCHRLGARVTGSDRAKSGYLDRLRSEGLSPFVGHDSGQVPPAAEVVVSTAVPDNNVELARARERGQRILHRGELLAEVCSRRRLIAVSGTHGKTTTAGMIAHVLRRLDMDPCFFLGGELPEPDTGGPPVNAGWGDGEWVVAEADESDGSFLELSPEIAVVTNVELDHHARWGSVAEVRGAFRRFVAGARSVVLGDSVGFEAPESARSLTFGAPVPNAPPPGTLDLRATTVAGGDGVTSARVSSPWGELELELAVPGRHNLENALAAIGALGLAGVDAGEATTALSTFPGMRRRLELVGEVDGVPVFDDYAHHPTEVRSALEALRQLRPHRLVAAFQPHLYSRTRALAGEFGRALAVADVICVLDVYPAREEPVGELAGVSGLDVARAAAERSGGRTVAWLGEVEGAAARLSEYLREGDVLVTLGAGDVDRVALELVGAASAATGGPAPRRGG